MVSVLFIEGSLKHSQHQKHGEETDGDILSIFRKWFISEDTAIICEDQVDWLDKLLAHCVGFGFKLNSQDPNIGNDRMRRQCRNVNNKLCLGGATV